MLHMCVMCACVFVFMVSIAFVSALSFAKGLSTRYLRCDRGGIRVCGFSSLVGVGLGYQWYCCVEI